MWRFSTHTLTFFALCIALAAMALTGSTISPDARVVEANNLVITDGQGSLTLLLTYNFAATTAIAPYYPRSINGYVQSTATTGAYSQYKFTGSINGTIGPP